MTGPERTYVLGGETQRRSLFGAVTPLQLTALVAYLLVWLILLVATQSFVVLLTGLALGAGAWIVARRRTTEGDAWSSALVDRLTWRLTGGARQRPDYVPGESLPREVGDIRVLAYAPPAAPDSPMALIHHRDHRHRSWASGRLTATFEITGGGDGLLSTREVNTAGYQFERLLGGLAGANIPVDQLDICTRVLPVHPDTYRAHMAALLAPDIPPRLRASMHQLAGYAAGTTEEYRSFATVRIPLPQLAQRIAEPTDLDGLCAETFNVLGDVVARVGRAGHPLRAVLGPRRLGSLIRHLHDPDLDIDLLDGITTVTDGWSQIRVPGRDWVRTESVNDTHRPWYHAVASVPRDAWPLQPVTARWMEHLVTGISPATIRTIQVQWRLVPKVSARERARLALTYNTADRHGERRRGQVSTGVSEAAMSSSSRVLHDLLTPVVGGTFPAIRVHVSAPTPQELAAARVRVTAAAETGGLTRLRWHHHRHHQALLLALPMARGIKA
ncbi:SCO6880 family protein [Streptomyces sp. B6B3]|uniref:SCO6880 family protein n=1 Tax=Streptomyces sp. B6B3 TaxID=3153570 RepID=UPI00325D74EA